jgi:homocitrate synthase NifV
MELDLPSRIIAWNRALKDDILASVAAGAKAVEISLPLSDIQIASKLNKNRKWVLDQVKEILEFCQKFDIYVSVGGEDASRADTEFLKEYIKTIEENGADRFRFCDTVGILDPFSTYETIKALRENSEIDIEIHTHNDFGMATANALAAIKGGATHVNTTVIGLGERAGNAPLEEIIMASKHVYKNESFYKTKLLRDLSSYVAKASKRRIEPQRPVIGNYMFTHESGIHTDGVLKNPANYEPFSPEELNMKRRIVFGNQSGRAVLKHILEGEGLILEEWQVEGLLCEAKKMARKNKALLKKRDIFSLCKRYGITA